MTENLLPAEPASVLTASGRDLWGLARVARSAPGVVSRVEPGFWAALSLFLILALPRLGAVPMWDSRIYYDGCLMPSLDGPFDLLKLNCFGHPSMLYMILLVPGQLLRPGSAILLNLTDVGLGCLGIGALWSLTTILFPGAGLRSDRLLATALFAVWPAAVGSCLNMTPDYGVLVFFLVFLALLLRDRRELAAVAAMFLVFSKESGVLLYGATTLLFFAFAFFGRRDLPVRQRFHLLQSRWILLAPALLYLLVSALTLTRRDAVFWGGNSSVSNALKRFVLFNPGEIFLGPYGPAIWVLSFSWILSAFLLAAVLRLALSSRAREALRSSVVPKRPLLFLVLLFAAVVYLLTRYETYANVRYLLPIAPLLVLVFLVALQVVFSRPALRRGLLGVTLLLLFASNLRTLDPVSRALWGTFSFGRHELLRLTSWMNECCGYSRDQLVYNLEYLKIHDLENAMFQDIRPGTRTTFVANTFADWFLAGRVTLEGERTLRTSNTVRIHFANPRALESRRSPPRMAYFVSFPNFDNGEEFQRFRRSYEVMSSKTYEISGYSIPVYRMRRKRSLAAQATRPHRIAS